MHVQRATNSARVLDRKVVAPDRSFASRHRVLIILLSALAFILFASAATIFALTLYVRASDKATQVEVADVVARFNDNAAAALGGGTHGPAPGVYVYDTTGDERVDILGGRTHSYPNVTTVTITRTPCGFDSRWDALEERWDERRVCTGTAGNELRAISSYHEFFGRSDRRDFQCDKGSLARPSSTEAGFTWSTRCVSSDAQITGSGQVVGTQELQIGGDAVNTLHYRVNTRTSGSSRGTATHEFWIVAESGLIVQEIGSVDSEADSLIGSVRYQEAYTIRLRSLVPLSE